ncbi:S8 family serine peptidase [Spirilliplanes yamanashiensis]|uniref:Peptidase S8/S53 domain-containing protein n=1 Tax=Spirilliplanes yamanashiensis TaxID=42233 RepID=A0A8J3YAD9_9ACTN|nr:S8 family serine peptidase [Spirilliplanes yamanashiensis]MDP9815960.1 subtilisin family serine protease [Spirilliplanes yamanashiensis]GIJ04217.1 hypothetical protein Sya03_35690 [Spirilliplanes yamanashiensis]
MGGATRRHGWGAVVPLVVGLLVTGVGVPARAAEPVPVPAPGGFAAAQPAYGDATYTPDSTGLDADEGGLTEAQAAAAVATAADQADGAPVSLIVGLTDDATDQAGASDRADRAQVADSAAAPVERAEDETGVAVSVPEPVAGIGAVTVDVPAAGAVEAAAALRADPAVAYVEPDHVAGTDDVSVNDPYRNSQWGLDRTRVPAAWSVTRGSGEVVVAVVDTGVSKVSELSGRVLAGYDFVNNDSNPADDNGHGTQVATVITGAPNNGAGSAGVCWYCRILPVKALGANGSGSYSAIAKSITWAADRRADIINLSLGGDMASQALTEAVAYANARGSLVVAAAGNDGSSALHYPAATAGTLSVGASMSDDRRYPWSNYGASWVDVAAPGCNLAQTHQSKVAWFCGTSSATPFVAGLAALARSLDPEPTATQIRNLLTATAVPVAGGWVGQGRVDAREALTLSAWTNGVAAGQSVRGTFTVQPWYADGLAVTKVVAAIDGTDRSVDTVAPWSLAVDTQGYEGPATLTLTAYNGTTPVGQPISTAIVVDNSIPTVAFASPATGVRVGRTVSVAAHAADSVRVARVELVAGGRVVARDYAAPYVLRWASSGSGVTTLALRVVDSAGNAAAAYRRVTLDNAGPAASFVSGPRSNSRVKSSVRVRVAAGDPAGVARVQLLVNGRVAGTATGAKGAFTVKTAQYGRTLKVKVRAYDRLGNVRSSATRTWRR